MLLGLLGPSSWASVSRPALIHSRRDGARQSSLVGKFTILVADQRAYAIWTVPGRSVRFSAQLALPEPAVIVGLPLELEVTTATTATLGIALSTIDPFENDTAFDGIDFFAVAGDAASYIFAGEAANRLRRAFFTHDHFLVTTP